MVKQPTAKQAAEQLYLKGCAACNCRPENYKRWTIANFMDKTEELRSIYKVMNTKPSVAKNTAAAASVVAQAAGETLDAVRERAKKAAAIAGRAIPIKLTYTGWK